MFSRFVEYTSFLILLVIAMVDVFLMLSQMSPKLKIGSAYCVQKRCIYSFTHFHSFNYLNQATWLIQAHRHYMKLRLYGASQICLLLLLL